MLDLLWTVLIGFVVGVVARFVMPGTQSMGRTMTCLLGIVGALGAGFVGQLIGVYDLHQSAGWIGSAVGALVLLYVVQKLHHGPPTL